jgi:chemotaxis signal transduction protein
VPLDAVQEMMQLRGQQLEPLALPGAFRYRVRLHQEWLPVAMLHSLLHLKVKPVNARSGLLILQRRGIGGQPARYGLIVDSISRAQQFSPEDLQTKDPETGAPFPSCTGRLRWNEKWHPALDLETLLPWADLEAASRAPHAA